MKPATILLFSFLLLCATVSAQVYKRIGPDGQVYFSDQPGPGAEPVELSPPQIISMPPLPERKPSVRQQGRDKTMQADDGFAGYTAFSVLSPTKYEAYRANDGNITIRLALEPALRPGHGIVLNLDGQDGEQALGGQGMDIPLYNLSRGLHTVWAKVVDNAGKVLIKTESVDFYMLRVAAGG